MESKRLVKVKDASGIVKDTRNGALISNDIDAFKHFKQKRKRERTLLSRIDQLENRLARLEAMLI